MKEATTKSRLLRYIAAVCLLAAGILLACGRQVQAAGTGSYEELETVSGSFTSPFHPDEPDSDEDSDETDSGTAAQESSETMDGLLEETAGEETAAVLEADTATYVSTAEEAARVLREQMVDRQTECIVYIMSDDDSLAYQSGRRELAVEIKDLAFAHTGVSTEGDYLLWQWGGTLSYVVGGSIDRDVQTGEAVYYLKITYTVSYWLTTAEEEEQLTADLAAIEEELELAGKADAVQAQLIYDYICTNVTYDYDHDSDYMKKYTAYAALEDGTAVCQGYALLFYRMALDCGLDARVVSGYSQNQSHGWNLVLIGEQYYYVDSTWDSALEEYAYFLVGSRTLLADHQLAYGNDSLAETSSELVAQYDVSVTDYDLSQIEELSSYTGWYSSSGEELYFVDGAVFTGICEYEGDACYFADGLLQSSFTGIVYYEGTCYYVQNGIVVEGYTGIAKAADGSLYYLIDGEWDSTAQGLVICDTIWYYLEDGLVNTDYTGLVTYSNGQLYYVEEGVVNFSYTGLAEHTDGLWYYIKNGIAQTGTTSVVKHTDGKWYYVIKGIAQMEYTGLASNSYGWWYLSDGTVDFTYTGFAENSVGWWYIKSGQVMFSTTSVLKGTVDGETAWWYVKGGLVTFTDTVAKNDSGWWVIQSGKVNFSYTGFAENSNGWWYCKSGKVQFGTTSVIKGTVDDVTGWYYVKSGAVQEDYTGLASNSNGWWYLENGTVNFSYTGIASNSNGTWYVKGGKIQFSYTGYITVSGKRYYVSGGKVKT